MTPMSKIRLIETNINTFLISNFPRVVNVVLFLLGDSLVSEASVPTFRNTLLKQCPEMSVQKI